MTEYFVVKEDGTVVDEKDQKWHAINYEVKSIGLKQNGEVIVKIDIPSDAEGIVQCKFATCMMHDRPIAKVHIIGYKKGGFCTKEFNMDGTPTVNFREKLDLDPHTLYLKR